MKTWILLLFLSNSNCDTFNYPLIKDYLLWNHIKVALFLICGRSNGTKENNILLNFKDSDLWTNYWVVSSKSDLSNFDYEHFLLRSGYQLCVIVDWDCSERQSILREISERKMFHYERHWLMFGTDAEEMFNVLSREFINVDAEVAVVIPAGKT